MLQDLEVSHTVYIRASPSKMWTVLTNSQIIKEYLFGTETITDWKPGSEIIFQGEYQGTKYRDKGVVVENVLCEKIVYRYWSGFSGLEDKPENYSTITYTIKRTSENYVNFTWTQKGFANDEAFKHSDSGMKEFMEKIKAIAER